MSKDRRSGVLTAIVAAGAIAAIGAAGGVLSSRNLWATSALTGPNVSESRSLPGSFAPVIERVSPAVVSIRVTGHAPEGAAGMPPQSEIPEPFKRFFGDELERFFGQPGEGGGQQRAPKVQGMGSGFFVDPEGHIVTNNHVVANADRIEIMIPDGETYEAALVGRDPKTDLALLKVKSEKAFPYVRFGDSSTARVGDWIVAVGSPFGLGRTATTGIVSARGRDIGAGPYDDFLQIDASINRGNSGGPTFNVEGDVIGVNTAILSPTGVSAGIGFAIPSNMAKSVIDQLKETGEVSRGWLGVHIQEVTEDLAAGLGMEKALGAIVANVAEDGPAAEAGLEQGDVIVAVDDKPIEKFRELPRLIASIPAGKVAELTVIRDGAKRSVDVRIGDMPSTDKTASARPDTESRPGKLGMSLAAIDDATRSRLRLGKDTDGVLVVDVDRNGIAAEKGIRPGDIIRRVSGQPVGRPDEVIGAVETAAKGGKKALLMLVRRGGNDRYVALPLRDA